MKGYSTFHRAPGLELFIRLLIVKPKKLGVGVITTLQVCSRCILQPQPTGLCLNISNPHCTSKCINAFYLKHHPFIYIYIYICVCVCVCVCVCMCLCVCVNSIYIYIYIYMYVCMYICVGVLFYLSSGSRSDGISMPIFIW